MLITCIDTLITHIDAHIYNITYYIQQYNECKRINTLTTYQSCIQLGNVCQSIVQCSIIIIYSNLAFLEPPPSPPLM